MLKFHRDFTASPENLLASPRFHAAINHSSLIYASNSVCTWIPKVGCSSLRYSIAAANGFLTGPENVHWIHKNNRVFQPTLRDCYDADYSFVFLRCPLERIVSAFVDKLVDGDLSASFQAQVGKLLKRPQIESFFSFGDFVRTITRLQFGNEHWQSQAEFLLFDTYEDYFNLHEFSHAQETLRRKIGFDLKDTRSLLRHDTSHYQEACVFKAHLLSIAELRTLKSQGLVPTKRSFLCDEIVHEIQAHWRKDFELFERHFGRPPLWHEVGLP